MGNIILAICCFVASSCLIALGIISTGTASIMEYACSIPMMLLTTVFIGLYRDKKKKVS